MKKFAKYTFLYIPAMIWGLLGIYFYIIGFISIAQNTGWFLLLLWPIWAIIAGIVGGIVFLMPLFWVFGEGDSKYRMKKRKKYEQKRQEEIERAEEVYGEDYKRIGS